MTQGTANASHELCIGPKYFSLNKYNLIILIVTTNRTYSGEKNRGQKFWTEIWALKHQIHVKEDCTHLY